MRISVVILFGCAVVFLLGSISLVPAYVLSKANENILSQKIKEYSSNNVVSESEVLRSMVIDTNQKIRQAKLVKKVSINEIIRLLISKKNSGIKISGVVYSPKAQNFTVVVNGIADDRESMTSFVKSLDNEVVFDEVNVPVSNYAKSKDIPFSITISVISQ